ncbi:MAG: hypothetical protein RSE41_05210 [Clostridia bacterium]
MSTKFDLIMDILAEVNDITGLTEVISNMEIEVMIYESCLYYAEDSNSCILYGDLLEKGCLGSCSDFKDREDV